MAKSKTRDCNVAMIGTKFMGRAHANAYLKVAKFFDLPVNPVMHTVCGRNAEQTPAFAERWGWKHASLNWKDVVKDPEVDFVDICTPNNFHEPIAVAALENGKHVACEKPLAASLDVARKMRDAAKAAKKKGAKTFVWFSYRGCPALGVARDLVSKMGPVYHVRANYLQGWAGPDTPLVWRFIGKVAGSGAHGDLGAHSIDAARFITGQEVTEICGSIENTFIKKRLIPEADAGNIKGGHVAKGAKKMGKVTVDDAVAFLGRLSGGGMAIFEATRFAIGNQNANCIEVNCEKGSIRWNFEDANILWYYNAEDDPKRAGWQRIMCTDAGHHPFAHAWWPDAHIIGYEHGFINLSSSMFNVIGRKKPEVPVPDFEDAYQTQRVLEGAVLSARNRTWINMKDVK
ncbi:MAG: gfo/Idh/MocA family oxidoreductase [Phycisphaera sp.]|nr:gfo/Idh/MocA family oxidoreductase [Phycisphaera sp.]